MVEEDDVRRLDAGGLKALAHPLRMRMLDVLRNDGPATATQLAQRLGESTGTTSWHLRLLAEHGFIEEDPDRGSKRDRWWRTRTLATQLAVRDFAHQPELLGTIGVYLHSVLEQQFRRAADFVETGDRWLPTWQDAATISDFRLRLDPAALQALNEELFAVVERYRGAPAAAGPETAGAETAGAETAGAETAGAETAGAETVVVQIQSFPREGGQG